MARLTPGAPVGYCGNVIGRQCESCGGPLRWLGPIQMREAMTCVVHALPGNGLRCNVSIKLVSRLP
jgi:hypothetical protein